MVSKLLYTKRFHRLLHMSNPGNPGFLRISVQRFAHIAPRAYRSKRVAITCNFSPQLDKIPHHFKRIYWKVCGGKRQWICTWSSSYSGCGCCAVLYVWSHLQEVQQNRTIHHDFISVYAFVRLFAKHGLNKEQNRLHLWIIEESVHRLGSGNIDFHIWMVIGTRALLTRTNQ